MKMRLKDGKTKVLTLSYDDAGFQDIRLIEIMDTYGIKGTFNVNSGRFLQEDANTESDYRGLKLSEAINLYKNSPHEVAVHTLTHPSLNKLDASQIMYEISEDQKAIESNFGKIPRGMAYPFGEYNNKVLDVLKKCHISYARTVESTYSFEFPENWLLLHPTCHHDDEKLTELIKKFIEDENFYANAEMFYLWGHSFEFYKNNNWDVIENFCKFAGGHEHIWYATNIEIYNYVKAFETLQMSDDKKIIYNPSDVDIWFEIDGEVYTIKSDDRVKL